MGMVLLGNVAAQESTPSQKTSDAIQKFTQTPKAISRSLEALTEAAKKTLQQAVGEKPATSSKATSDDLTTPPKQSERPAAARFSPDGRRDPFQPMTLRTKNSSRPRENLSPLERLDLGQISLVGIVWDEKEPKAVVEIPEAGDTARGYIVKIGTPIGTADGKIKGITRNEVIVEEFYTDTHGVKRTREVSKKLTTE
jgi:type IV pilus assembly protein PilP